jgi:hypothetical protein
MCARPLANHAAQLPGHEASARPTVAQALKHLFFLPGGTRSCARAETRNLEEVKRQAARKPHTRRCHTGRVAAAAQGGRGRVSRGAKRSTPTRRCGGWRRRMRGTSCFASCTTCSSTRGDRGMHSNGGIASGAAGGPAAQFEWLYP